MKITPVDLAHKSFAKKMFGVDETEVADYLNQVASVIGDLIHERNALREKIRERDLQLAEYKERDQLLKNTISTAAQMSEKIRQDAEREGKLILADAQQKSDMFTRDVRDSLKKMYQEVADLKRTRLQFEANLKALAQAHLSLLEQGEKFMPQIGLPQVSIETANSRNSEISPLSTQV
jgi:cell division initiation protein